ncbi:hypothetical protein V5O48_002732 [Marasmius crinis-equi]|uniref:ADF-H domain-containing protein n=1 Tax=Marasmius crinis-equi TaxID=585013 RepID=A0ABR3FVM4_9AGAR
MDISNLVDYGSVLAAYDSIVKQDSTWFLLTYSENVDRLVLYAQGRHDLPELKSHLTDLTQVYIGFYHEALNTHSGFVLINYIPTTISGVRRARALVHSRRIGSALIKTEHAILTVDHISNITPAAIRDAILNPDSVHTIQINRSFSSITVESPHQDTHDAITRRRSFTETYAPSFRAPSPPPVAKSSSMFSNILRRKQKDKYFQSDDEFGLPPPPPPKDKGNYNPQPHTRIFSAPVHSSTYTPTAKAQPIPNMIPLARRTSMSDLVSEFAVISHEEVITKPPPRQDPVPFVIPLEKKWIPESTFIPDPEERARRRRLMQEQREREEEEAMRAEEERQARIKHEKEEMLLREQEEERQRRASLDEELRRARAERRLREEREKEEDLRKKRQIEARRRADRERRQEEHRKQEKWRQEQAQLALEAEARNAQARKRGEAERKQTIQQMVEVVKKEAKGGHLLDGWVTLQTSESVVWRRRYFRLIGSALLFYRNDQELNVRLDELDLQVQVAGIREWNEGFEELKAIPHSFAIQFKDGRSPWALFTDSAEEKDKLLGILYSTAGLKV